MNPLQGPTPIAHLARLGPAPQVYPLHYRVFAVNWWQTHLTMASLLHYYVGRRFVRTAGLVHNHMGGRVVRMASLLI